MGDVDKLQVQEEAAAQRAQEAARDQREKQRAELREQPLRTTAAKSRTVRDLPLTSVRPGDNIRADLPEIQELALSIREVGLLTPLIVRPWDTAVDGREPDAAAGTPYRLVAGHRRHAALTALVDAGVEGHDTVPCEVREGLSEAETYALMLTENVQRVPMEPIQAARALRLLLDLNEDLDATGLARSLGLRPAWAQTHLKLLDLPAEVQARIEAGDLSVKVADLLRRAQTTGRLDEKKVLDLAAKAARGEITSAQVREQAGPPPRPNTEPPRTVRLGPDGRPLDDAAPEPVQWRQPPAGLERPPTPLSGERRAEVAQLASQPIRAGDPSEAGSIPDDLPMDEKLDAYLLGRALREWASDDYIDDLGIDRSMVESWAEVLTFEERIRAIRELSYALLQRDAAEAIARA